MVTRRLTVQLAADATRFRRGMAASGDAAAEFRSKVKRSALLIGAALAAAGAAAVKMAADFEREMTRIVTLVGVAREQVQAWEGDIRQVARNTGQSTQELAQGLFAITSGGERGAQAMEVLEAAGQAAALGLGSVEQIGRTATAALQAFGDMGLTAKAAVEQMVATVREGNLRADELAGALGRVIPIAAQVGVSFAETNAFIATFTRLGVDARVAATALRSALTRGVIRPTEAAREAFEKVGIPLEEFRRMVAEDATGAFIRLLRAARGNLDVIGELIPNVRALAGVLGTAGSQADTFRQVTDNIANSTGILAEGMEVLGKTTAQQFAQVRQEFATLLQEFGAELLPLARDLASALRVVADVLGVALSAFKALPEPVRQFTVTTLALTAAIGGTVALITKMVAGLKALALAIPGVTTVAGALAANLGAAGLAGALSGLAPLLAGAASVVGGFMALQAVLRDVDSQADDTRRSLSELRAAVQGMATEDLVEWRRQVANARFRTQEMINDVGDLMKEFGAGHRITQEQARALGDVSLAGETVNDVFGALLERRDELGKLFHDTTAAINEARESAETFIPSAESIPAIEFEMPDLRMPDVSEGFGELEAPFDAEELANLQERFAQLARQSISTRQQMRTDLLVVRDAIEDLDTVTAESVTGIVANIGTMAQDVDAAMALIEQALGDILTDEQIAEIRRRLQEVNQTFEEEGQTIADTAKSMAVTAGESIIQGLILGSNNLRAQLRRFFANLASKAIMSTILSALSISSPSRLTMRVGEQIGEGLVVGLKRSRARVAAAADSVSAAASPRAALAGAGGMDRRAAEALAPGAGGRGRGKRGGEHRIEVPVSVKVTSPAFEESQRDPAAARRAATEEMRRLVENDPRLARQLGGGR